MSSFVVVVVVDFSIYCRKQQLPVYVVSVPQLYYKNLVVGVLRRPDSTILNNEIGRSKILDTEFDRFGRCVDFAGRSNVV